MVAKKGTTKFNTPLEELEIMDGFSDSPQYAVLQRWAKRYIANLKNVSFKLLEHEPSFIAKHAEYAGQALGIMTMLRFIKDVQKEINKAEDKK
jgi:hypothetical protein